MPIESRFTDHLIDFGSTLGKAGSDMRDVLWKWFAGMEKTASNSVDTVGSDITKFPKSIEDVAQKSASLTADGAGHGLEIGGTVVGEAGNIIAKTGGMLQHH